VTAAVSPGTKVIAVRLSLELVAALDELTPARGRNAAVVAAVEDWVARARAGEVSAPDPHQRPVRAAKPGPKGPRGAGKRPARAARPRPVSEEERARARAREALAQARSRGRAS